MSAVIADTQSAIWYMLNSPKLSANAVAALQMGLPLVSSDHKIQAASNIQVIW